MLNEVVFVERGWGGSWEHRRLNVAGKKSQRKTTCSRWAGVTAEKHQVPLKNQQKKKDTTGRRRAETGEPQKKKNTTKEGGSRFTEQEEESGDISK